MVQVSFITNFVSFQFHLSKPRHHKKMLPSGLPFGLFIFFPKITSIGLNIKISNFFYKTFNF